jgi:hypothetical protein
MPDSLLIIERALHHDRDRWDYELHFSLFCFLDDVQFLPIPARIAEKVREMVGAYLMRASRPTAKAAWMAADLLGDHWESDTAGEDLLRAALQGPSAVARRAALHGLETRLSKVTERDRRRIVEMLRQIALRDRSQAVKRYARRIADKN